MLCLEMEDSGAEVPDSQCLVPTQDWDHSYSLYCSSMDLNWTEYYCFYSMCAIPVCCQILKRIIVPTIYGNTLFEKSLQGN